SGISFSDELRALILEFNNGRPVINRFDTEKSKARVFEKLLSFNKEDKENVFKTHECLINRLPKNLFALALDPFGNYVCINKNSQVFLWLHETSEIESIGTNFVEMVNRLY